MSDWLKSLNPEQREATSHDDGPLLILAGAGSGKTTVLVSRTGRLIAEAKAPAERICVLTFTNKAAQELKHRVSLKLGTAAAKVWSGTFHGFGLRFLKTYWKEAGLPKKFGVIDGGDVTAVVKDLLRDHHAYEKERFAVERLIQRISLIRQDGESARLDDSIESEMSLVLAPKFTKRLRQLGVVDFEDLLLLPLKMMKENDEVRAKMQARFDYVMVDEFQDTNATQMRLLDQLIDERRNLTVVGDDDQSIYGWRGAEIRNILDFPKRYKSCKVVRLERNYRSSSSILDLANAIIATNEDRHKKVLRASLGDQGQTPELFIYENEEAEVDGVIHELNELHRRGHPWRSMAILYRSNSQGGLMEGALRRSQIPYKLTGGTALFDRKEAKDAMAFIRSAIFPTEVSFRRILNLPPRGIGEKTIEAIEALEDQVDFHKKAKIWAEANRDERASQAIFELFRFLERLKAQLISSPKSAEDVLTSELRELGYRKYVEQSYRDLQVAEKHWTSVMILGRILDGMFGRKTRCLDTLETFIDLMELRDPVDESDHDADEVQMMTLHACKGLEFPTVFLLGLEEDLLPHARLGQDVNEERRLFYVGVTRAKKHLVLTRVRQRKRYGRFQPSAPSRFLLELDPKLYVEFQDGRPLAPEARKAKLSELMQKLEQRISK